VKSSAVTPAIASAIERPIHHGVYRPFGVFGRGRGRGQVLRIDGVPLAVDLRVLRVRPA